MNNNKGVVLMLVLITFAILSVLGFEITKTSSVEYRISINSKKKVQAYYLSKSVAKLSLLRLHMYKEFRNIVDDDASPLSKFLPKDLADQIWSIPLPELPLVQDEEAPWPGSMSAKIDTDSSKIPINLLDGETNRGSSKESVDEVKRQLTKLIEGLLENEEFDKKYRGLQADDLIGPLKDWVDVDEDAEEGGSEDRDYSRLDSPYLPRNDRMPTLSELHMVKGWTDDFINYIGPSLSVFNRQLSINPNFVSIQRLKFYGPDLTNEDLSTLQTQRLSQPFGDLKSMEEWIQSNLKSGNRFSFPEELKGHTTETSFVVEAVGSVGKSHARHTIKLAIEIPREKALSKCLKPSSTSSSSSGSSSGSGSSPNPDDDPNKKADDLTKKCGQNCKKFCKLLDPEVLLLEELQ